MLTFILKALQIRIGHVVQIAAQRYIFGRSKTEEVAVPMLYPD